MKVLDPGHLYELDSLDGDCHQLLTFVKREGEKYPGNVGSHPGTTIQEVLRVLIDRLRYVNNQEPCAETELAATSIGAALYLLEVRAARKHGRFLEASIPEVTSGRGKCLVCGHVGCNGCRHD